MYGSPRVGVLPRHDLLDSGVEEVRTYLARVADAGIDHVCAGDHVSFGDAGFDGLVQAAALAALHPTLPVHTAVYLLPLRNPVLVARQLADISRLSAGRLVFGVGVGGEDRHEVSICGVEPATRGRRMDESLQILRGLLTGSPTTFRGRFFDIDRAVITPAPDPAIPIIIGGRSDIAIRRAGRLGDGWLGIWNSARRFADAVDIAANEAARAGRVDYPARHGMQVWCGFGDSKDAARGWLAPAMQAMYRLPFEQFERYCPFGTPEDIAEFLSPYVEAGCAEFNLIPQAADHDWAIAATAEVRKLLAGR
jgi:alkanesulfonate monooxygenase SsuD/methylene tetrahydromethanopterin reductase-like flavin-dependent oxidoreductase (luciferase family)